MTQTIDRPRCYRVVLSDGTDMPLVCLDAVEAGREAVRIAAAEGRDVHVERVEAVG